MKIPKQAKRVFKGEIFDVYHWQQEMFDGSKETFEMLKRPNTIEVIPIVGDKIIVAEQEQPTRPLSYTFFGGRQEEGETPIVTAKRELMEESGLESDDIEELMSFRPYHKIDWEILFFVARDCKKVAEQNLDPGEKITVKEVSFEEFLDIVESDKFWGLSFQNHILRLKQDKKKLEEFRKKLFKK